jgi:hypothetical protein
MRLRYAALLIVIGVLAAAAITFSPGFRRFAHRLLLHRSEKRAEASGEIALIESATSARRKAKAIEGTDTHG